MCDRDPVELVQIHIAVLVEAVCAAFIFGGFAVVLAIMSTPVVPV